MGTNDGAQFGRDGEGDEVIRHRQESAALTREPFGGVGVTALRTGAVVAGMIGKMLATTIAPEELTSERGSAATENGGDGAPVRRQQTRAKLPFVGRPVAAQDFSQRDQRLERLGFFKGW